MGSELPKIIAIVGTNASGKSSIGIELAKSFNGEIISADSRQIYRGFDLCCGKITAEESQIVPHHLIDIKNVGESFSVYDFQKMTYSLIPQILHRGKTPFIVGGTGNYVRSVVRGFHLHEETADMALHYELGSKSICELQSMLTPDVRAFLASNPSDFQNKRRLIRNIEKTIKGVPLNHDNTAMYDVLQLGITWPKDELHKRIDERLTTRIEQGMIGEIKEYIEGGGNHEYLVDLGLEYKYILKYLSGEFLSFDDFKLKLAQAIKRFAKRQATWYKADESIHWIDMGADYMGQALSLISGFLGRCRST